MDKGRYNVNKEDIEDKLINGSKGDDDMETLVRKEYSSTQECLDMISKKLKVLNGNNGIIILDKNNKDHIKWYDDEDNSKL